jgi:hypothetical protein
MMVRFPRLGGSPDSSRPVEGCDALQFLENKLATYIGDLL